MHSIFIHIMNTGLFLQKNCYTIPFVNLISILSLILCPQMSVLSIVLQGQMAVSPSD